MSLLKFKAPGRDSRRHLRVMHACEKGATGVYWGHRVVSSVLFRDIVPQLSEMHRHEMEHHAKFTGLMRARGVRAVAAPVVWCAGGILYGVLTALGGRRAIWRSTAVIESIVERELIEAREFFRERDPEICQAIDEVLADEVAHKLAGEAFSPGVQAIDTVVVSAAKASAAAAKSMAERV